MQCNQITMTDDHAIMMELNEFVKTKKLEDIYNNMESTLKDLQGMLKDLKDSWKKN